MDTKFPLNNYGPESSQSNQLNPNDIKIDLKPEPKPPVKIPEESKQTI